MHLIHSLNAIQKTQNNDSVLIPSTLDMRKKSTDDFTLNLTTAELMMTLDSGSNAILTANESMLNNFAPCVTSVGTTGNSSTRVIFHGELKVPLNFTSLKFIVCIKQYYVMPSNKHHTLCLMPYKNNGLERSAHAQ